MRMQEPGIDFIGITTPFYCTDGKGKFLLHKRSSKCRDDVGVWDCGGGKLEFGQTLEENVLREVKEEYGCSAVILKNLLSYTLFRVYEGKKTHWIAFPFLILVNPMKVKNNDPEKIDKIGWFTVSSFPQPLHIGVETALKKYISVFSP
ncbi:MAG: NUDIX hydrolase [Patescibacteria group bacterium]